MYDNIKSPDALEQGLDFSGLFKRVKFCTDIDNLSWLANDKVALIESKKETFDHSVENIINSKQWKAYRSCGRDKYIIYATHNLPIDKTKPIPLAKNIVKYVEFNEKPVTFKKGISVEECLDYLGGLGMYYIRTQFKNGKKQFMKRIATDKHWSSSVFNPIEMGFKTLNQVKTYLNARKNNEFNKGRTFTVWYLNDEGELSEIKEAAITC